MATHSGILAWKSPWTEEPGRLQSVGLRESDATEQLSTAQYQKDWNSILNFTNCFRTPSLFPSAPTVCFI